MSRREGFVPCPPPQARTRPSPRAATVRERDAPMPHPTNAILDAESIPPASRISVSAEPSTLRRPTHAFSRSLSLAAAHSIAACKPHKSPCPSFFRSSVTVTSQPVQLSGSRNLLWCRGWFGWFGWFEFFLSHPLLTFPFRNLFLVFHIPPALGLFHLLGISIGHSRTTLITVLDDGLYLGLPPPITDLDPGSEETREICTHGGHPPQSSSCQINPPHLTLT